MGFLWCSSSVAPSLMHGSAVRGACRRPICSLSYGSCMSGAAISIETRSEHFGHGARHDVDERLRAFREAPAVYDKTNTAISKPYYNLQVGARH